MIFSIIITFNPVIEDVEKLIVELKKASVIPVVVDNSSDVEHFYDCENIRLSNNKGIAKAQNIGIERAIDMGAKYVVFFDQDSLIPDAEFIKKLHSPLLKNEAKITAPIFKDRARGYTYPIVNINKNGSRTKHYPTNNHDNFFVNNVISSGCMVSVDIFKHVGVMIDDLFIDYVDTEWCLRASKFGFNVLVVPSAQMIHSIGDESFSFFGLNVTKHSPFRRYFRIRNSFYLLRCDYIPKVMAIREIIFSIGHQIILIFFSKGLRYQYVKSLFRGLFDGVFSRFN
ncbi:Glycosyl transferase family 2 [Photobacterium piscicola]|uniref:Glycosyl transferase family 2 n=1 Tax=Photobacterium piscicola TaxID=1378299 RepID=A0A1T5I1Q9_9GAMM|nr:glycosyltransferase family 2 protein [Photobacterium piscicola]SKC33049.1 Glycosyl transferase family 2 [Photobacterium piscicola]